MSKHPFKKLRQKYEISVARAKLEFAEAGDDDKVWARINERQDKRDEAIYAKLQELPPPDGKDEIWELCRFIELYLEVHNQLGIVSEEVDLAAAMIRLVSHGVMDLKRAERHPEWFAEEKARRVAT